MGNVITRSGPATRTARTVTAARAGPAEQWESDQFEEIQLRLDRIEEEVDDARAALSRLAAGVTTLLEQRIEQELERRLQGA